MEPIGSEQEYNEAKEKLQMLRDMVMPFSPGLYGAIAYEKLSLLEAIKAYEAQPTKPLAVYTAADLVDFANFVLLQGILPGKIDVSDINHWSQSTYRPNP